jgi:hypothetical protein
MNKKNFLTKFKLFLILYNFIYLIGELINWVFIIFTNTLIYQYLGKGAFLYLLLSTFFSMGLHPAAMHVIAEHYEFVKG